MTASPPGWDTRPHSDGSILWRYRPGRLHIDLHLWPALTLPSKPPRVVRAVTLDTSPWFRFEDPAELRKVAAAINQAADWLDTTPEPEPGDQQTIFDALETNRG